MSGVLTIKLTRGLEAVVDLADEDLVSQHHWFVTRTGTRKRTYVAAAMKIDGVKRNVYLHRFLLDAGKGTCVDHINDDPLDNRRSNLRFCSPMQNGANRSATVNSKTGIKGVYFLNLKRPWFARLQVAGRPFSAGGFKTRAEAVEAYAELARKHHGEYAYRQVQIPKPLFNLDEIHLFAGSSEGFV